MIEQGDRRKITEDFIVERRLAERVSILEIRADNHETVISDHKELIDRFFSKFDEHIIEENAQTQAISNTMIRVSTTVDNLTQEIKRTNDTLVTFATKVENTHDKVTEWDTVVRTLVKVAVVGSILIGALWSVYTFLESHNLIQHTVQGK